MEKKMKISDVIRILQYHLEKHGDIDVVTDCSFCGRSTAPTTIVLGPPVLSIKP